MKFTSLKLAQAILGFCCLLPGLSVAQMCNNTVISTTPTERFVDNADGTITDTKTGLMWQKCIDGRSGSQCQNGSSASYTWPSALVRAEGLNNSAGFANHVDWRVPNIKELLSITEKSCFLPAINLTVFPNTDEQASIWSSTPFRGSYDAYFVNFLHGGSQSRMKGSTNNLRLVRNANLEY